MAELADRLAQVTLSPLATVDSLFEDDATTSTLRDRFTAHLTAAGVVSEALPVLDARSYASGAAPPQSLVRLVGMVQDMGNNEIYLPSMFSSRAGRACTMFRDNAPEGAVMDDEPSFDDRRPLYVVAAPGLQPWAAVRGARAARAAAPAASAAKRPRSDDGGGDDDADPGPKKAAAGAAPMDAAADARAAPGGGARGLECVVRVYGPSVPKLNDLVEFVGVLGGSPTAEPASAGASALEGGPDDLDDYAMQELEDDSAWDPPLSRVARLHCVSYRVLDEWYPRGGGADMSPSDAEAARGDVLDVLAAALGGDRAAAEYCLYALCAKTEKRHATKVVGAFSLNLRCVARSGAYAAALAAALGLVAPRVVTLRTSDATAPLRSAGSDKLPPSHLQLPKGTVVVVDVDGAPPDSPGAHAAIRAIAGLLGDEKRVPYNYGFMEQQVDADFPSFLVSGAETGGLDCDCVLPLSPEAPPCEVLLDDARLDRARDYVARSRSLRVAIDDGAASDLEDQYLAARATGKISQAAAEKRLDAWVAVSKLHAKSLGDDKLAPKHWNAVFTLEGERARRLAVLERAARP